MGHYLRAHWYVFSWHRSSATFRVREPDLVNLRSLFNSGRRNADSKRTSDVEKWVRDDEWICANLLLTRPLRNFVRGVPGDGIGAIETEE